MTFHTVSLVYRGHQNILLSKQTIYMGQEGPKYVIDISECSNIYFEFAADLGKENLISVQF